MALIKKLRKAVSFEPPLLFVPFVFSSSLMYVILFICYALVMFVTVSSCIILTKSQ
uniref:Uncharacterized protein n=1 Tax=Arundo donax TaxID=35708 RepID=A0A0A9E0Q3_ARUDO